MRVSFSFGAIGRVILSVGGGALLLLSLSACADIQKLQVSDEQVQVLADQLEEEFVSSLPGNLQLALALADCEASGGPAKNTTIDIQFVQIDDRGTMRWCPTKQTESCPEVFKTEKVQWRAVTANADGEWDYNKDVQFKVVLSPFSGDTLTSGGNGKTGMKPLAGDAPPGIYKYTVDPDGGYSDKCKALDPNFWVND